MRIAVPIGGALTLGVAVAFFTTEFRQTREHGYRSREGTGDFALEIPRRWAPRAPLERGGLEYFEGRLPSGLRATLFMSAQNYRATGRYTTDSPPRRVEQADRLEETWVQDGWCWSLTGSSLLSRDARGSSGHRIFTIDLVGPGGGFSASVAVMGRPTEADCLLLERCLRSLRWIGR